MKAILRLVRDGVHRIAVRRSEAKGEREETYPHFFWTSEMESRGGCDRCPIWAGRWWLNLDGRKEFRHEWNWFTLKNYQLGAGVTLWDGDGEDGITLHVGIPWLCSVYFGVEGFLKYRPDVHMGSRFEAVYLFNREFGQWGCLAIHVNDYDRWDDKKVFQISKHWDPCDFLFGQDQHSSEVLRECEMELSLEWAGERETYNATAKIEQRAWTRPRDPLGLLTRRSLTVNFNIPEGIPEPGKGENSWDCDDDATFGVSRGIDGVTDDDLIRAWGKVAEGIIKTRQRRGGESWKPKREAVA